MDGWMDGKQCWFKGLLGKVFVFQSTTQVKKLIMLNIVRDIEIVFVSVKDGTSCLRKYTVCEKVCE